MRRTTKLGMLILASAAFYAAPANAQATRTWVSGVGDDANPCSRTAPCKTFAGAISKTAAGGEINCLDPAGFGGVTITKAMSIICEGVEGGVLVSGTNAIIINAGVNDNVVLSGLDIEGLGTGLNGVRFLAGASLIIEDSTINGFRGANGTGVSFAPSGFSLLQINNVTVRNSGQGTGGGIVIQPQTNGGATVSLNNVELDHNFGPGLKIDSTGNIGGGITVTVNNIRAVGNTGNGITINNAVNTAPIGVMISNSTVAGNGAIGISANGGSATGRVGTTNITGNATGVSATGGAQLLSYGTNQLDGNPTTGAPNNGTFSGAIIPLR